MKHNILYSFRRCPYAIRARWALLITNQLVELREVDLKNKPIELIQISKKATVPVLKTSLDEVIDESLDIITWSIELVRLLRNSVGFVAAMLASYLIAQITLGKNLSSEEINN